MTDNKRVLLPNEISEKLKSIDVQLEEDDITIKGYCKQRWALVHQYVTHEFCSKVKRIQEIMARKEMDEKEGYAQIFDILKLENIYLDDKPTVQKPSETFLLFNVKNKNKTDIPKTTATCKEHVFEQDTKKPKTTRNNSKRNGLGIVRESKRLHLLKESNENKANINNTVISQPLADRCLICYQYLTNPNILLYKEHPKDAVDEIVALTDPKLLLFTGEESDVDDLDHLPLNKITSFTVYDTNGHLCPFDTGLVEKNVMLYFSGYIKPIYDENPFPENGIPVKDVGPINAWWVSGFDGGKKALAGLSTAYGEYYLMQPSKEYSPVMQPMQEKFYLNKVVIEYLIDSESEEQTYEDLLNHLNNWVPPEGINHLSEEILLKHAEFICHQVANFDAENNDNKIDDFWLISLPCMQSLIDLAGIDFAQRRIIRKLDYQKNDNSKQQKSINLNSEKNAKPSTKMKKCNETAITPLVKKVFDSFTDLEKLDITEENKNNFCGICVSCQMPACDKCVSCQSNKRKLGKNDIQQICKIRRCLQIENKNISDSNSETSSIISNISYNKFNSVTKRPIFSVKWDSPHTIQPDSILMYYKSAIIDDRLEVKCGDFVLLHCTKSGQTSIVAKIAYMFNSTEKMFHGIIYRRGTETILGEIAHPMEIFAGEECEDCPLGSVIQKAQVYQKFVNDKIQIDELYTLEADKCTFFCHKRYDRDRARFEDLKSEEMKTINYSCENCAQKKISNSFETPKLVDQDSIIWRDEIYTVGTSVYLTPGTFRFKCVVDMKLNDKKVDNIENVDEEIYPEFYRKKSDALQYGANGDNVEPFCIGYIVKIIPAKLGNPEKNMNIKVQKLYRPENTHKSSSTEQLDINFLYWSLEQKEVNFNKVAGKCYLAHSEILDIPATKWSLLGPDRFYFSATYDSVTQQFLPVQSPATMIGRQKKSSKKTKSRDTKKLDEAKDWPSLKTPLKTLDCFAGCGGLSEGLHQSGVSETKWAIEMDEIAAKAFELNNPTAAVHAKESNEILNSAISGNSQPRSGLTLPIKGEVELLVGGPPCQGFSGMNRFNAGQHSLSMNSLVLTYLSYCDYYRPKYFVLENVRNFAVFKKGIMLKLTLRCLLAMGYQCTFGILQAGNFGVPQARRRLIILATAPGEILPQYPEPTHVMSKKLRATELDILLDNCRYNTGSKWQMIGAPYRTITVRDAMSDLPVIPNGCQKQDQSYDRVSISHFQRLMRGSDDNVLQDHICKEMAPIVEARMSYIPSAAGSDWRDLPNIVIRLSDGTFTNKLRYEFEDKKNGRNSKGACRGVCPCASKKPCDQSERQFNTLIPWCLPHTANRHNHWVGLYGRLEWDGVFATTVTNPEPMGKQGRVLHPIQHRVVSVRECARSQGFPDTYKFYGNTLDKYRQIGNAVPPPLGVVIGREIIAAILKAQKKL